MIELLSKNSDPNMTHNENAYAICCRPEVAGGDISGENIKTLKGYALFNFEAAIASSFRENQNKKAHQFVG